MRLMAIAMVGVTFGLAGVAQAAKCPVDSVQMGRVCVDKYEASAWEIPPASTALIKKVKASKIKLAGDLAGATQRGVPAVYDYPAASCPDTGAGCKNVYAVSIAGVQPSVYATWFVAAAACRNAGKRLLTNAEWQLAALGTPDSGTDDDVATCNIAPTGGIEPVAAGSRSQCVSDIGAYDMVGNLWEWVADWSERAVGCTQWGATFGGDDACIGNGAGGVPGAIYRGGNYLAGATAGVFAIEATRDPSYRGSTLGFRCARDL